MLALPLSLAPGSQQALRSVYTGEPDSCVYLQFPLSLRYQSLWLILSNCAGARVSGRRIACAHCNAAFNITQRRAGAMVKSARIVQSAV